MIWLLPVVDQALKMWRVVLVAFLLISVAVALLTMKHKAYVAGEQAATQKIKDANDAARRKADAGSLLVRGCNGDGDYWDRAHGVCWHASSSGR